ncbi:MAG: hypothetical protein ABNH21_06590 [Glaciecola sp.]|jgi:hypothetical protein
MANQFVVTLNNCSYGKKGTVVNLNGELSARQKVMLKPYKAPEEVNLTTAEGDSETETETKETKTTKAPAKK